MVSKTRLGHRMRCSSCLTRFRLKRQPDSYLRAIKCPSCKSFNVYSTEASRRREVERQDTCSCSAYPFPHRRGSMTMCHDNPDRAAGINPSQEDIDRYMGCLATPRSGVS